MHEQLLIVRHGSRQTREIQRLRHGADGNVQTLRYSAAMVREAATDERLRQLALHLVSNCSPHDSVCEVSKLFEFVRDEIRYVDDPPGVERIADAWATIEAGAGDCGDKAILLSSLLITIGYRSQFIVQNWNDDVLDHGFDHVHAEVFMPDGSTLQADPTERSGVLGWEKPSAVRMRFPIWFDIAQPAGLDRRTGVGGLLDELAPGLIQQGVQYSALYAQDSRRQSQATRAAETQINSRWNSVVLQVVSVLQSISARVPNITVDDLATATQYYQALEQFVAQYPTEYVTQQWNDPSYRAAFQHDLNIYQQALAAQTPGVVGTQAPGTVPGTVVAGGTVTPGTVATPGAAGSSLLSSPWTIAAVAGVVVLFLWKK